MKASALLILLLFPSLVLGQQQYYGTKAASVLLPLPADPMDARLLSIKAGDSITPDNIRSSIQALYSTGRYRTISVDANPVAGGTQVSFIVTAQYYFSTISLEPAKLLDRPVTSAGRHPGSDVFLDDITVSRRHAEFRWENDELHVVDVGSLSGTFVNREPVESAALVSGDEVQMGKFRLLFVRS